MGNGTEHVVDSCVSTREKDRCYQAQSPSLSCFHVREGQRCVKTRDGWWYGHASHVQGGETRGVESPSLGF